jgi:hypothetical protein
MAKRVKSSEHHFWAARDGRRMVFALLMLIFVGAASLSDGQFIPNFRSGDTPVARNSPAPDVDLRTGSVLITPKDGNICEHRLIDNATWRIRRNGVIVCDTAVTWQPEQSGTYTSQSRLEVIRDGFVSKR